MPYAVRTQAPRPSCFLTEVVVVDDCSVGETTGARSSMQNLRTERSWRNVRYASRLSASERTGLSWGILLPISLRSTGKCDQNHSTNRNIILHNRTIGKALPGSPFGWQRSNYRSRYLLTRNSCIPTPWDNKNS